MYLKTREGRKAGVDKSIEELEPCILVAKMSNGAAITKTKTVRWTGV